MYKKCIRRVYKNLSDFMGLYTSSSQHFHRFPVRGGEISKTLPVTLSHCHGGVGGNRFYLFAIEISGFSTFLELEGLGIDR